MMMWFKPAIAGEITLQWNPITSDTRVVGYEVHYRLTSGQYTGMVDAAASGAATSSRTVTNLTDGSTYFFAVRARNADGTLVSAFSNQVSATIPATSVPPSGALPSININDASVNEGAGTAAFTVRLSAPSMQPVSVRYTTSNGTATAGSDYSAASASLTIPAGVTSAVIAVAIINDRLDEPNETFNVTLSGAVGGTIADARGVGAIVDNDSAPATPPASTPSAGSLLDLEGMSG